MNLTVFESVPKKPSKTFAQLTKTGVPHPAVLDEEVLAKGDDSTTLATSVAEEDDEDSAFQDEIVDEKLPASISIPKAAPKARPKAASSAPTPTARARETKAVAPSRDHRKTVQPETVSLTI